MDVLVFGAGSLGSLLGGLLSREHDVTLVGRADHVEAIRSHGLELTGQLAEVVHPDARTEPATLEATLALVTVKAYDTDAAASALAGGTFDAVCSLQNGMGNEDRLAEAVSAPVLAGTTTYGALLEAPGRVACTGMGSVTVGHRDGGSAAAAGQTVERFETAGITATESTDMPRELWCKLAINAGINPVTALTGTANGAVLEDPAAAVATAACEEASRVARANGVDLSASDAVTALRETAAATAENTSSMRRDLKCGRRTEIDAINGYVIRAAGDTGISVPTNRTLTGLVRAAEEADS